MTGQNQISGNLPSDQMFGKHAWAADNIVLFPSRYVFPLHLFTSTSAASPLLEYGSCGTRSNERGVVATAGPGMLAVMNGNDAANGGAVGFVKIVEAGVDVGPTGEWDV